MPLEEREKQKQKLKKEVKKLVVSSLFVVFTVSFFSITSFAQSGVNIDINSNGSFGTIEVLLLMMILSLLPSILIMMTSFTRIVIVLSFLRNALGTSQSPPNQIIIGLALFLSLFIMSPVIKEAKTNAYDPFVAGEMTRQEALAEGVKPFKVFMINQTSEKSLALFLDIADEQLPENFDRTNPETLTELGLEIIVPSFITSELQRAFTIGFLLFIPFLIIDMVVSSVLMSMGMIMLPPAMVALPFKIMTFIVIDGWGLLLGTLVKGFRM
ncbi:MAG: flagellar type III secretion system pore protein FliP [Oscillospiraceae bacterium]